MNDFRNRLASLSQAKRDLLLLKLQKARGVSVWLDSLSDLLTAMTVEDLEREAKLDPAIDPASVSRVAEGAPASVLLTGATGFLGAFLLDELLRQTKATIYCLTRATDREQAATRIFENLASYLLSTEVDANRIVPVIGDLSRPLLGLTAHEFAMLSDRIDSIYHCGAVVKWTYPYKSLKQANVLGTQEVLRLATTAKLKPVHFISTVGTFSSPDRKNQPVLEIEDLTNSGTLHVGYAQSKWVAERLVAIAKSRGLPVTIFRPNIAGHSRTGAYNRNDHVYLMIKGCIQLGSAPELDHRVSGAPVDFVSAAIVYLSGRETAIGKTFHLVNPADISWADLCNWMRSYGYPLRRLSLSEWRADLTKAIKDSQENALRGFLPFFTESMISRTHLPVFDVRNTNVGLSGPGITCPPIDSQLLETYFAYFVRNGDVRAPTLEAVTTS